MRAPCRSILGALVFVKCGFLGSLSVAAYKMRAFVRTCMRVYVCTYIHNVQWRHGSALSPFIYFNTLTLVQGPQCSRSCNHRWGTDAGLGCYCFPYWPEQHIYFSHVLSSHFMAEKTIRWVKSAALLAFCLFAVLKAE